MSTPEPHMKLWMERDGLILFSEYRVRLLEHVAETGSLAEAAARMGLSYRRAWGKIKEIERNLGVRLVTSRAGGAGGGGTALTPDGERLVAAYRRYEAALRGDMRREFAAAFRGVSF